MTRGTEVTRIGAGVEVRGVPYGGTAAGGEEIRLGSELKAGIAVSAGARLTISPL